MLDAVRRLGRLQMPQALVCLRIGGEERLDPAGELRIFTAKLYEPRGALGPLELNERIERRLYALPAAGIHGGALCQRRTSPASSAASHARAKRKSRFTVAGDTSSTSAVSSSDKPPK